MKASATSTRSGALVPAFSLIELLVAMTLIALLIALLMPALGKARRAADNTLCISNLHQVAIAAESYAGENGDWYPYGYYNGPGAKDWPTLLTPYLTGITTLKPGPLSCPTYLKEPVASAWQAYYTYTWNRDTGFYPNDGIQPNVGHPRRAIRTMSGKSFIIDGLYRGDLPMNPPETWLIYAYNYFGLALASVNPVHHPLGRHPGDMNNLSFFDGHVAAMSVDQLFENAHDLWDLSRD
jgi:prepilin-type processing-associated H-X9-DG protein